MKAAKQALTVLTAVILLCMQSAQGAPVPIRSYWRSPDAYHNFNFLDDMIPEISYVSGDWSVRGLEGDVMENITFEEGDTGSFTPSAGDWSVADGEYRQNLLTTALTRSFLDGQWGDFTLELDATPISDVSTFLIYFGYTAADSCYSVEMNPYQSILKKNASNEGARYASGRFVHGQRYHFKLAVNNGVASFYFDNSETPVIRAALPSKVGGIGIGTWNSMIAFDNVKLVTAPSLGFANKLTQNSREEALAVFARETNDNYMLSANLASDYFRGNEIGIALRTDNEGNGYYGVLDGARALLRKVEGGKTTVLGSAPFVAFGGKYYLIGAIAENNRIRLRINNEDLILAEDSAFSAGRPGLYSKGGNLYCEHVLMNMIQPVLKRIVSGGDTTYYVSASEGDDANDGKSPQTPWKTADRVNHTTFAPGDAILFRRGDLFEGRLVFDDEKGSPDGMITVSAYGEGARPLISSFGKPLTLHNVSHFKVEGMRFELRRSGGIGNTIPEEHGVDIIHIVERDSQVRYENIIFNDNEVIGPGPGTKTAGILCQTGAYGFVEGAVRDIFITNNHINGFGYYGVFGSFWDRQKNSEDRVPGIYINQRIDGNVVENIGFTGIMISSARDATVNRNVIRNAGSCPVPVASWAAAGIFPIGTSNCEIRFNEVYNTGSGSATYDGMGIDVDWATDRTLVEYNYVADSWGSGIATMATDAAIVRKNKVAGSRNLADNSPGAITLTDFSSTPFVKNSSVTDNVIIVGSANGTAAFGSYTNSAGGEWVNNTVRGNTVVIAPAYASEYVHIIGNRTDITVIDGTKVFSAAPFQAKKHGVEYTDLQGWSALGYDRELTWSPIDTRVLPAVEAIAAARQPGLVRLTWNEVPGAAHYNVFRSTSADFEPRYINMAGEAADASFTDTEAVLDGVTYYYKVVAENASGADGAQSAAVMAEKGVFEGGGTDKCPCCGACQSCTPQPCGCITNQ